MGNPVTRVALICSVLAVLAAAPTNAGDDYAPMTVQARGGVEGGDALILPRGDILNVRNIQGGMIGDTNLDIGAGSTEHPGNLSLNYDVGRRTLIYDGRKRLIASFGPGGIKFYVKPKLVRRP